MSSVLISTDQIDPRPNVHSPMRVALPPMGGPHQRMRPHKIKKHKSHKKKKGHRK